MATLMFEARARVVANNTTRVAKRRLHIVFERNAIDMTEPRLRQMPVSGFTAHTDKRRIDRKTLTRTVHRGTRPVDNCACCYSTLGTQMQFTLNGDSFGRVVGTIAHNGAQVTVTSSDFVSAMEDLRDAVENALADGYGECFWHEAAGDYRWLFRREERTMRVAVLWSMGTLTGWEHRFWTECDVEDFRNAMRTAIESPALPH